MHALKKQAEKDKRRNSRREFPRYVLYSTPEGLKQGDLVDYSYSGVYIKTRNKPALGTTLTVALPYSKDPNEKREGMVVRIDDKGFAVEFFDDPKAIIYRTDII